MLVFYAGAAHRIAYNMVLSIETSKSGVCLSSLGLNDATYILISSEVPSPGNAWGVPRIRCYVLVLVLMRITMYLFTHCTVYRNGGTHPC